MALGVAACQKDAPKPENSTQDAGGVVTEIVTDTNGEPVTDAQGTPVTEIVSAAATTQGAPDNKAETTGATAATTAGKKKGKTDEKTTAAATTTKKSEPVKAPKVPQAVINLKADNINEDSITLKWDAVSCDGYQVAYSADNQITWSYLDKACTATQFTVKELQSYTEYAFRVRAYNKNEAGTKTSAWSVVTAKTKSAKSERTIEITVLLPAYGNREDKLIVSVNDKVTKEAKVHLNKSQYKFKTDKKYKDLVSITAEIEGIAVSRTVETDKDAVTIDISTIGIQELDGGKD